MSYMVFRPPHPPPPPFGFQQSRRGLGIYPSIGPKDTTSDLNLLVGNSLKFLHEVNSVISKGIHIKGMSVTSEEFFSIKNHVDRTY